MPSILSLLPTEVILTSMLYIAGRLAEYSVGNRKPDLEKKRGDFWCLCAPSSRDSHGSVPALCIYTCCMKEVACIARGKEKYSVGKRVSVMEEIN